MFSVSMAGVVFIEQANLFIKSAVARAVVLMEFANFISLLLSVGQAKSTLVAAVEGALT